METKKWYQSLGIWGAVLLPIFALALPIFGQADLAAVVTEESAGLIDWLATVGTVIASAMTFYGRIRATKRIDK